MQLLPHVDETVPFDDELSFVEVSSLLLRYVSIVLVVVSWIVSYVSIRERFHVNTFIENNKIVGK